LEFPLPLLLPAPPILKSGNKPGEQERFMHEESLMKKIGFPEVIYDMERIIAQDTVTKEDLVLLRKRVQQLKTIWEETQEYYRLVSKPLDRQKKAPQKENSSGVIPSR
jgi:hypothetical protein